MRALCCAVLWSLAVQGLAFGAEIARRDGRVVEGSIAGFIALRGATSTEVDENNHEIVKHSVSYCLLDASEIVAITQVGITRRTDDVVAFGLATRDGADPDNLVVLDRLFDERNTTPGFLLPTRDRDTWLFAAGGGKLRQGQVLSEALLGEYRRDPGSAAGELIPAIRLTTQGGTVTLPVAEIVPFAAAQGTAAALPAEAASHGSVTLRIASSRGHATGREVAVAEALLVPTLSVFSGKTGIVWQRSGGVAPIVVLSSRRLGCGRIQRGLPPAVGITRKAAAEMETRLAPTRPRSTFPPVELVLVGSNAMSKDELEAIEADRGSRPRAFERLVQPAQDGDCQIYFLDALTWLPAQGATRAVGRDVRRA
ncbi:MAG TPA: hypothetical protein VMT16_00440 [Thermoanaerobaculia bacterium]|nr:hypothetical protein [Thermoanaerobaculia bacterium]